MAREEKRERKKVMRKLLALCGIFLIGLMIALGMEVFHQPLAEAVKRGEERPSSLFLLRTIFVNEIPDEKWLQFPPGSDPEAYDPDKKYDSKNCINCHTTLNGWLDAPKLHRDRVQHPMGRRWQEVSCMACHDIKSPALDKIILDGYNKADGTPLQRAEQVFTCISCHTSHSDESNTKFLKYASFAEDSTRFCEYCHHKANVLNHVKSRESLSVNNGKHFIAQDNSPLIRTVRDSKSGAWIEIGCGGCMLCHVVHAAENDPRDITIISPYRADLATCMRVPAKALEWGGQGNPNWEQTLEDPLDRYEAICFGCHGQPEIVGGDPKYSQGENVSLLRPSMFFSHRFACKPGSENILLNTGGEGFPVSDGMPGPGPDDGAGNDYGTISSQIYCGTCHNVHSNQKQPYLYRLSADDAASPYVPDDPDTKDVLEGFCEQCHGLNHNSEPMIQVALRDGMPCISCHSTHLAKTNWNESNPLMRELPEKEKNFYLDADHDNYGDPTHVIRFFFCPEGYVENNLDCDDYDRNINPMNIKMVSIKGATLDDFKIGGNVLKKFEPSCFPYTSIDLLSDLKKLGIHLTFQYKEPILGSSHPTYWFFNRISGQEIELSPPMEADANSVKFIIHRLP